MVLSVDLRVVLTVLLCASFFLWFEPMLRCPCGLVLGIIFLVLSSNICSIGPPSFFGGSYQQQFGQDRYTVGIFSKTDRIILGTTSVGTASSCRLDANRIS